jgi:hypothetical protein
MDKTIRINMSDLKAKVEDTPSEFTKLGVIPRCRPLAIR